MTTLGNMKYRISIVLEGATYYWTIYSVDPYRGIEFIATGSVFNSLIDTIAYSIGYILQIDKNYSGPITITHEMVGYPTTSGHISISKIDRNFDYYNYAGRVKHEFDRIHKILK